MWGTFKILHKDPVIKPFTSTPFPIVILLSTYLIFVLNIGKKFMKNRPAYNVKNIMLIYNIIQVAYNGYMFYICLKWIFIKGVYDYRCMTALPQDHPLKNIERDTGYLYVINKALDLLDTVFIVLRKNWKQITILHLYHHTGMVIGGFLLIVTYGYGGHICITVSLNTLVHIFMYTYYSLSIFSDNVKGSLWWKKYVTKLQLMQFMIIFLHTAYVMIFSKDCSYPRTWLWIHLTQSMVMVVMFANFYVNAYIRPKCKKSG